MSEHRQTGSTSLWSATALVPQAPPLDAHVQADVCVIGAGIAGLTTAYELLRAGREVVVLDQAGIAAGQTARTTAHLCDALDDRFHELERLHGEDGARLAARSHREAIARIERICREEGIDPDFEYVDGYLVLGEDAENREELEQEYEAARRAGLEVDRVDAPPGEWSAFGRALRFRRQAQFHATKYMAGLARAVTRLGGRIHGQTHVHDLDDGDVVEVKTDRGAHVQARAVVVAANTPFNDRVTMHTKQGPYRTYVVAFELERDALPAILLWDTQDPYHYVRTARIDGRDWLIVGGEDHKVGQEPNPEGAWAKLEDWTRRWIPAAGAVGHRWSGQVYEPVDSLGYFGHNPGVQRRNVYIATGDSGNGITHGTLAGITIAELITGRPAPYAELYDPARRNLHAGALREYASENANMVAQYKDLVTPGDVASVDEIAPGEGAIVRDGLSQRAVYRDHDGQLHAHSAVCPHLGGIVSFNRAECSFDCPVHGSRFDARDGRCLNGPAPCGLAAVDGDSLAAAHPAAQRSSTTGREGPTAHR
ncbi:FAD-dependent oxidoreductase [Lysobacter sp. N42]|uniref:FAD-dependent oxidoreductase n=1 Tax=Lysobacter sp. N42 TaxID=2545719 RepID=UPI00104E0313|nr:FAD-dependent oxidoreductase [Lysobacter sp. N42]TCZ79153.1 FAD-dependent oxidoreductase [Lysobacter sp. N42]